MTAARQELDLAFGLHARELGVAPHVHDPMDASLDVGSVGAAHGCAEAELERQPLGSVLRLRTHCGEEEAEPEEDGEARGEASRDGRAHAQRPAQLCSTARRHGELPERSRSRAPTRRA